MINSATILTTGLSTALKTGATMKENDTVEGKVFGLGIAAMFMLTVGAVFEILKRLHKRKGNDELSENAAENADMCVDMAASAFVGAGFFGFTATIVKWIIAAIAAKKAAEEVKAE